MQQVYKGYALKILLPNFNPLQKLIGEGGSNEIWIESFKGGKSNSLMKTLLLAPEEVDDLFF